MTNRPQQPNRNPRAPRDEPEEDYAPPPRRRSGYQRQSIGEAAAKSLIRSIASSIGRILVRTITGRMR
jgi:uncharacterized protein